MLYGLATMLLDIVMSKMPQGHSPTFKAMALGALTYGNVRMGMNHYHSHDFGAFLRLRIYQVVYDPRCEKGAAKLTLVAEGTAANAQEYVENLDIFDTYWLDAARRDPVRPR